MCKYEIQNFYFTPPSSIFSATKRKIESNKHEINRNGTNRNDYQNISTKKHKLKQTQEWKITTEIDYLTRTFQEIIKIHHIVYLTRPFEKNGKNMYDPENVPSVQVSKSIPHGFSLRRTKVFQLKSSSETERLSPHNTHQRK
jgi:hypothetical protein